MSRRSVLHNTWVKKWDTLHSSARRLEFQSESANSGCIRKNALNRLFDLINEIRPDPLDLLDDETKLELISIEEELRRWHKE
jgi:fructosamine-3-kinase